MSAAVLEVLERSRSFGFLGPGELGPQVEHALGFTLALGAAQEALGAAQGHPGAALDLGSGGGLPGLVLAERWPQASVVLLDAALRRTAFLREEVAALGWEPRVQVVRDRAESAARHGDLRGRFDVVVARSFGPPPVTAECGSPFLARGGLLVVSEPPPSGSQAGPDAAVLRWPRDRLAELGLEAVGTFGDQYRYRVMRQLVPCPVRYPRRVGVPAKRPLYQVPDEA